MEVLHLSRITRTSQNNYLSKREVYGAKYLSSESEVVSQNNYLSKREVYLLVSMVFVPLIVLSQNNYLSKREVYNQGGTATNNLIRT